MKPKVRFTDLENKIKSQPPSESTDVDDFELFSMIDDALEDGTFGNRLQELNFKKLTILKECMDGLYRSEELEKASKFVVKMKVKINKLFGREFFRLGDIKEWQEKWDKLYKELEKAGIAIEKDKIEKFIKYFKEFFDYLETIDPEKLGHNLTEWHVGTYAIVKEEQKTPQESEDGKVVLSCNKSFEDNLKFFQKHIAKAMALANEKRSESSIYLNKSEN